MAQLHLLVTRWLRHSHETCTHSHFMYYEKNTAMIGVIDHTCAFMSFRSYIFCCESAKVHRLTCCFLIKVESVSHQ